MSSSIILFIKGDVSKCVLFSLVKQKKELLFYDTVSENNWLFLLIFLINEHDNTFSELNKCCINI